MIYEVQRHTIRRTFITNYFETVHFRIRIYDLNITVSHLLPISVCNICMYSITACIYFLKSLTFS